VISLFVCSLSIVSMLTSHCHMASCDDITTLVSQYCWILPHTGYHRKQQICKKSKSPSNPLLLQYLDIQDPNSLDWVVKPIATHCRQTIIYAFGAHDVSWNSHMRKVNAISKQKVFKSRTGNQIPLVLLLNVCLSHANVFKGVGRLPESL
jgi:hypothetical protein